MADHGVRVTSDRAELKDGFLYFVVQKEQDVLLLRVRNTRGESVYLNRYTAELTTVFILQDDHGISTGKPFRIASGKQCEIRVRCRFPQSDVFCAKLSFQFNSNEGSDAFRVDCPIEVSYQSALVLMLAPTVEHKRTKPVNIMFSGRYNRTAQSKGRKSVIPLKQYSLPVDMEGIIRDLNYGGSSSKKKDLLETKLGMQEYANRFNLLLHLQEYEDTKFMKKSYTSDIRLTRSGKRFIVKVESIMQHRLSCLPGDQVGVRPSGGVHWHLAHVHNVNGDEVHLDFDKRLQDLFRHDMGCTVCFTVSRLTVRIKHRAVELAHGLEKVLFPTENSPTPNRGPPTKLSLFDKTLNEEQSKAVHHIVAGSSRPAPYLVFGPPGTGKTVTLVEAIKQVEKNHASCHILACAHTNSAVDLLCAKIMDPNVPPVYRLYAKSQEEKVNKEDQPFKCNLGEDGIYFPNKEELKKHKIMVTTLYTASRLVSTGIAAGFYSHIFVDEAGQPSEPEGVIPLAGLLDPERGQVVLAGDPKQLGPIVSSRLAKKYGLGVSLLERLMELDLYKKDEKTGYNDRFITKLLRNYRSHGDLLMIPNKLFYEDELLVWAEPDIRNSLCKWKHLPNKGFPLIFHEVTGRMNREESTSLFNEYEVDILMGYLKELLVDVLPGNIGLMAPYRKQVERINKAVQIKFPSSWAELKVGTVEEFQGVERQVILLSTVRSTSRGSGLSLGFLADPKRFNVAMTRAQALLIVVGNSQALGNDRIWRTFIDYCREHGGYTNTFQTPHK